MDGIFFPQAFITHCSSTPHPHTSTHTSTHTQYTSNTRCITQYTVGCSHWYYCWCKFSSGWTCSAGCSGKSNWYHCCCMAGVWCPCGMLYTCWYGVCLLMWCMLVLVGTCATMPFCNMCICTHKMCTNTTIHHIHTLQISTHAIPHTQFYHRLAYHLLRWQH